MTTHYIDLLMDNGEIARIECPENCIDDAQESIEHCMKRRDWWCVGMFDGCTAEYMGHRLDRVNMGRVVAAL